MKQIVILGLLLVGALVWAQTLEQILDRIENQQRPPGSEADMTLRIINRAGQERVRQIKAYSQTLPNGDTRQMLIFTAPADVRDTRFLTIDYKDDSKTDEQYIFIPALRRVRQIGTSGGESRTGSFLGSDFTFADLGSLERKDFNIKLLGRETIDGAEHFVLEYTAKNSTVVSNYGYGRIVRYINTQNYSSRRSDYFNAQGTMVKQSFINGYKIVDGFGQFESIVLNNLETGGRSVWEFNTNKVLPTIDEKYFTLRFLERGR
jgi:hypothetical protein